MDAYRKHEDHDQLQEVTGKAEQCSQMDTDLLNL